VLHRLRERESVCVYACYIDGEKEIEREKEIIYKIIVFAFVILWL
jgi:hypothetical protein